MDYKYGDKIIKFATCFEEELIKKGINGELLPDTLREYSVKILITKGIDTAGKIIIYYKSRKDSFSIRGHELNNEFLFRKIENIFFEYLSLTGSPYKNKGIEIDVDGSYRDGITGYGAVIRKDGEVIKELSGIVPVDEVYGSYQIAGEIEAVKKAIEWCKENGNNEVTVYYDYKGLKEWATGGYKAKKEISKKYKEFMDLVGIKINWVKIESHSGMVWNNRADKLSKQALGNRE